MAVAKNRTRPLPIIRVFVSSTFSDLKHERNALHAHVWPELERYCQQRGFTFQAIDLRWGVPAEAGLDHRTMRICFEELRRSQETSPEPNFLILLGNRYGWRPLPEVISVEEFDKLKTAAEQIQNEPPDPAWKPSDSKVELLKQAVSVLEDWYLLDENAKPFGDKTLLGEYVLRTRKTLLHGVDYGKEPSAEGKPRDTAAWVDVQFVLWSIVNLAFPVADLTERFQTLNETSPGTFPSSVHFQASATEQEIWQGALQVANADRHVIAAVREIVDLDAFPNRPRRGDFIDLKDDGTPDDDARQALADLKAELERRLSNSPIIRSTCQWAIDKNNNPTGDVTTSHLGDFCREILARFKSIIIEQINAYWGCDLSADDASLAQVRGSQQELDLECADHLRFAGERAPEKAFVGRESELQRIRDYLHSETNQPFVVHGPSGSGKTALLGKIIQEVTPSRTADGTRAKTGPIVLTRFIGTTPESSNLRSLLSSLCRELRQDFEMTSPLPNDLNELIDEFYSQLGQATAARPVFVFLDALDQLDAADHGRSAFWIRSPLSSTTDASCHARMVVSCLSPSDEFPEDSEACEPFRDLKVRKLLGNHELGALDENDARELFARWLHGAGRSVSATQQDMIWSAMQKSSTCRQPLFLKVLFEEARRWRSFDAPSAIPDSLARLLDELFLRLGEPSEHGELIGIALSCLVSARYGLSESELLEILYTDPEYKTILAEDNQRNGHELPPDSNRIPIAPWTRLRPDLAPYLTERSAPGSTVIHFYHRQVEQAVRKRYLRTPELQFSRHRRLSLYFARQPWWLESRDAQRVRMRSPYSARRANVRKVTELPGQLFKLTNTAHKGGIPAVMEQSYQWIERLYRKLPFLEAKNEAGLVFELAMDFSRALAILPTGRPQQRILKLLDEALRRDIHFIAGHHLDHPQALFQCLWNHGWWCDCPDALQHYESNPFDGRPQNTPAYRPPTLPGPKLSQLLERWRARHESQVGLMPWVRSIRPPLIHLDSPLLATLRGHESTVYCVAYSPDGRRIASGSTDQTVRVWDVETGALLVTLRGHKSSVWSVAYSPDGLWIASGSEDKTVRVWNAESGSLKALMRGHEGEVKSVAYSPDGRRIASGSEDMTVRVCDAKSGALVATLRGHEKLAWSPGWVESVAYSPDGRRIATGSADQTIRVWDSESGELLATLHGHSSRVESVAYSPDGRRIVSGSSDDTVRLWDAESGALLATLRADNPWGVAFSPDGRRITSGGLDSLVRVWDAESGVVLGTMGCHGDPVWCVAYSPNGLCIVAGSSDGTVWLWDAESDAPMVASHRHENHVNSLAYSPDGQRIASGSGGEAGPKDNSVRLWDTESGAQLAVSYGHDRFVNCVTYSPNGRWIASGSYDTVRVWDAKSGELKATLTGHNSPVQSVAFSPDSRRLASGSWWGNIQVCDVESSTLLITLCGHEGVVNCVAYSPDGRRLVSGSGRSGAHGSDNTVRVWDAENGVLLMTLRGHRGWVQTVAYSPDGLRIASGADDGTVRVWDAVTDSSPPTNWYVFLCKLVSLFFYRRSRALLATWRGHTSTVYCVAYSPDGRRIASGSRYETVRVWDAENGNCLERINGTGDVAAIAAGTSLFSWRALARGLETVIEDAATGQVIARFPIALRNIVTHPSSRQWAGSVGHHVYIIALEGARV